MPRETRGKTDLLSLRRTLLLIDIREFDQSSLRREPVYYVALGRKAAQVKTHGFVVTGLPGSRSPRDMGKVYHCGMSIMHVIFPRFNGHRFPKYYAANSTSLGVL